MMRAERHAAKRASRVVPCARCLLLSLALSASPSLAGGTLDTSIVFFVRPAWLQGALALLGLALAIWLYRVPSRDRPN